MTIGELKKKLEKYNDQDKVDIMCYVDDESYTGCITDVYKNVVETWRPVIIQTSVDYYPSIEHRFQMLGRIVEDAIDRNSTSLANIAYGGR